MTSDRNSAEELPNKADEVEDVSILISNSAKISKRIS
jgi:hypothetical protein